MPETEGKRVGANRKSKGKPAQSGSKGLSVSDEPRKIKAWRERIASGEVGEEANCWKTIIDERDRLARLARVEEKKRLRAEQEFSHLPRHHALLEVTDPLEESWRGTTTKLKELDEKIRAMKNGIKPARGLAASFRDHEYVATEHLLAARRAKQEEQAKIEVPFMGGTLIGSPDSVEFFAASEIVGLPNEPESLRRKGSLLQAISDDKPQRSVKGQKVETSLSGSRKRRARRIVDAYRKRTEPEK